MLDGEHYSGTIKRVEPDGIVIKYADGVTKLKFSNLPASVAAKYGYSPTSAAQFAAQQQAAANASYQAYLNQNGQGQPSKAHSPTPQILNTPLASSLGTTPQASSPQTSTVVISSSSYLISQQPASISAPSGFFGIFINSIKEYFKSLILSCLHRLFPWAFPPPQVYYSSTTTLANPSPAPTSQPPELAQPPPPNPQQILDEVLSKNPVDAAELANVFSKYPPELFTAYQKRTFSISGIVVNFLIAGIDHEKAEITLQSPRGFTIRVIADLKQFEEIRQIVDPQPDSHFEWHLASDALFLLTIPNVINGEGKNGEGKPSEISAIGDPYKCKCRIRYISKSSLELEERW